MAKYKIIVHISKEITLEAPSALDAKRLAEEEIKKLGVTDKYHINDPKDLEKAAAKKAARKEKLKAKKQAPAQVPAETPNESKA